MKGKKVGLRLQGLDKIINNGCFNLILYLFSLIFTYQRTITCPADAGQKIFELIVKLPKPQFKQKRNITDGIFRSI